jgi:thiamine-monophosphate kinase
VARDTDGSPEDRLIARYFKPLAKHSGTFGFSDDASAITPPAGHDLVLKTDGLIAGVHFFADDPADGVARKALRVNLSDLAAKGAAPLGFLLAIALPKGFDESWLADFSRGLGEDADAYQCPLLGAARRRAGRRSCVRQRDDRRCGAGTFGAQGRSGLGARCCER